MAGWAHRPVSDRRMYDLPLATSNDKYDGDVTETMSVTITPPADASLGEVEAKPMTFGKP